MTTQVSMANNHKTSESVASSVQATAQATKLPYQANHQVELMHLQAEIEALLQQLKCIKQQRGSEIPTTQTEEVPVLVSR